MGGNDTITTLGGADLVVGGIGSDSVEAGEGNNVVIGDNGHIAFNLSGNGYDGDTQTLDLVETIAPGDKGGTDVIRAGAGDDTVLGGDDFNDASTDVTEGAVIVHVSGDYLWAGEGKNVVLGDNGRVLQNRGKLLLIESTETGAGAAAQGGNDVIRTGTGDDTIIAGYGNDNVKAVDGNNLVAGDSGMFTYTSAVGSLEKAETMSQADGGIDTVATGSGQDVIFGGAAGDIIDAGNGNNVVLGDNGFVNVLGRCGCWQQTRDRIWRSRPTYRQDRTGDRQRHRWRKRRRRYDQYWHWPGFNSGWQSARCHLGRCGPGCYSR